MVHGYYLARVKEQPTSASHHTGWMVSGQETLFHLR